LKNQSSPHKNLTTQQWIILGLFYIVNIVFLLLIIFFIFVRNDAFITNLFTQGDFTSALAYQPLTSPTVAAAILPTSPALQTVVAPTDTETPTLSPTPTQTATPAATLPPTLTPTPFYPEASLIENIEGHKQAMSLDCESRSAVDWAAYFGVQIDEMEFVGKIPYSDNPEKGFTGDIDGDWGHLPPGPYGVHAGPIADVLNQYKLNAIAKKGLTWENIKAEISAGRPVITWVVGHVSAGTPVIYTASDGEKVIVARKEHTVIVIGYAPDEVYILDGEKRYTRELTTFLNSWSVLGNMAILAAEPPVLE